jgi:predicted house-cleaning noncanonical NTP pyrophosphatase (MazG superfamily)
MGKLVRDNIPEIIRKSGREPEVKRIEGESLRKALKDKLVEEAAELRNVDDPYGELVDVLEVIEALIEEYGLDRQRLEDARKEKLRRAGGFKKGYVLVEDEKDKD